MLLSLGRSAYHSVLDPEKPFSRRSQTRGSMAVSLLSLRRVDQNGTTRRWWNSLAGSVFRLTNGQGAQSSFRSPLVRQEYLNSGQSVDASR